MPSVDHHLFPLFDTRREYFDYLDGWSTEASGIYSRPERAVTKAFLLETTHLNGGRDAKEAFLASRKVSLRPIDDSLFCLRWEDEPRDWALLEIAKERYPIVYTDILSEEANSRVDQIITRSSLLDRAWLSSSMFQRLWTMIEKTYPSHRFSKIVFEHESVFQRWGETDNQKKKSGKVFSKERRRARMQVTDRISEMHDAVLPWKQKYDPLASIVHMRVPGPTRGGHDVYFDGRFTNRSDSASAFRQTVHDVMQSYDRSTQRVEETAWPETSEEQNGLDIGAPLLIKFSDPLDNESFDRWVAYLGRKSNKFRLWGRPLRRGPDKVHFYAIDNHLWQPIDLEITPSYVYGLLPKGTCGNTVHRLITNIQMLVHPKVEAYIGDQRYEDFFTKDTSDIH